MYKIPKKPYTLAGFELKIFCSVGGRDDHYTTPPGHADVTLTEEKGAQKCGLLMQFSKNCPELTISQLPKIRPIWSPCW
jgi:hypothetical protein